MFNYAVPTQMVQFINNQARRIQLQPPGTNLTEEIAERVIDIVSQNDYFPRTPSEFLWRFENIQTGLTNEEKERILTPILFHINENTHIRTDYNTIHFITWASLMWCWSEEGEYNVRHNYAESARLQRRQFQSGLHQASNYRY